MDERPGLRHRRTSPRPLDLAPASSRAAIILRRMLRRRETQTTFTTDYMRNHPSATVNASNSRREDQTAARATMATLRTNQESSAGGREGRLVTVGTCCCRLSAGTRKFCLTSLLPRQPKAEGRAAQTAFHDASGPLPHLGWPVRTAKQKTGDHANQRSGRNDERVPSRRSCLPIAVTNALAAGPTRRLALHERRSSASPRDD